MNFMDARALLFTQNWNESVNSSMARHRFRTHSKEELECFERMLTKRPMWAACAGRYSAFWICGKCAVKEHSARLRV
jgi:hypothetical protein